MNLYDIFYKAYETLELMEQYRDFDNHDEREGFMKLYGTLTSCMYFMKLELDRCEYTKIRDNAW